MVTNEESASGRNTIRSLSMCYVDIFKYQYPLVFSYIYNDLNHSMIINVNEFESFL